MKALLYIAPEKLEYCDCGKPEADTANDFQLIKVMASGICGSDMHAFMGHDERRPAPFIFGHEAAGIVEDGPDHGKRVTINPLNSCGICRHCRAGKDNLCAERKIISMPPRAGAFAQYVSIPTDKLVMLPDHISHEKAALAEPVACGWHAVRLGSAVLDTPLDAANCLVIGGGAIGLGAALVLKAKGAKDIFVAEPNEIRRKTLKNIGGFSVFNPLEKQMSDIDLVIDGVGLAATRADACRSARPGAVIVHIGLGQSEGGIDVRRLTLQEITFIGTYTYTPQDFRDTAAAIFDGSLGALDWIETRPMSEGLAAFNAIRSGTVSAPKIILDPWA